MPEILNVNTSFLLQKNFSQHDTQIQMVIL